MGSKTRLSSYCSKRGDNTVNLVTSRKTNARLARPRPMTKYDVSAKVLSFNNIPCTIEGT